MGVGGGGLIDKICIFSIIYFMGIILMFLGILKTNTIWMMFANINICLVQIATKSSLFLIMSSYLGQIFRP